MVNFQSTNLERQLSPEEMEQERLRTIEGSDVWRQHAALHQKSGLGKAQLHISGEPLFGEEDAVRTRMGLPQKTIQESSQVIPKTEPTSYGQQHTPTGHSYTAPGSQPGLWASCNCGAEFKAEEKEGKLQVTSYGVVGSDSKATGYAVNSSSSGYGNSGPSSTYVSSSSAQANY
ncbi:hypothetical protein EXS74_00895 [Candidatus Woesearchaeota archaeon]|nr:hypothetical protein [Candidatus Woesearchaeota archaeon]